MTDESLACINTLKQLAFRHGLALPMLSIHRDFISDKTEERQQDVAHTIRCIELAARLGIPAIRLNSGRWNTIPSFDDLMKVKGDEPPIKGATRMRTRFGGASKGFRRACRPPSGTASSLRSRTTRA